MIQKGGENITYDEEAPNSKVVGLFKPKELEKYLPFRKLMYKKTKEFDVKNHDFDIVIHRASFHVKSLQYELHRL